MCWCDPNKRTPWCGPGCRPGSAADKKEPAPVPNKEEYVQHLVMDDLAAFAPDPVMAQIRDDLKSRAEYGLKKYGTLLQPHNGRNAKMDAYQEGLDYAVYLKQAMLEGDDLVGEYYAVLGTLRVLCRRLT
jgi:hypothetical protein